MTFRDDKEAMLVRAEALDREVQRLEKENARLRAEREAETAARCQAEADVQAQREAARVARQRAEADAQARREAEAERRSHRAHLETLAAKADAEGRAAVPAPRGEQRSSAAAALRAEKRMLRLAFVPLWMNLAFVVVSFGVLLAAALASLHVLAAMGLPFPPLGIVFPAAAGALMFGLYHLASNRWIARTRRWLFELPVSFDAHAYVQFMTHDLSGELTLELAVPGASEAEKETIAKAVCGALPGSRATWNDDRLRIAGPEQTRHYMTVNGWRRLHNAEPHRWFVRFVKRVLRPVVASHSVGELRLVR